MGQDLNTALHEALDKMGAPREDGAEPSLPPEPEEQAAILRKEVERDELRESEGVTSKAYREANEALSDMRIAWNRLYGGSYL